MHGGPYEADTATSHPVVEPHDGQYDFDFELGRWKMQLRKLDRPLHGSHTWIEFSGTSVTRPAWDGKAQVEEFEADAPAVGHIEGMTVRLYSTAGRKWSLYWANQKNGHFDVPTIGERTAPRICTPDRLTWKRSCVSARSRSRDARSGVRRTRRARKR